MADNFKFVQAQPFSLAGAGAIIGDTTLTLKTFTGIDGALLTMTDFGMKGFGTISPGNGSLEESIVFTGVTQNANGTATLTGVKSVLFVAPYTQAANLLKTHAGSSPFIISNTSGFYNQLDSGENDETITGTWTFTVPNYPRMNLDTPFPTDNEQLATKAYIDSVAIAGAPDASNITKGITKLSVAPASPVNPIAVGDNDTRVPPVNTSTVTAGEIQALVGTVGTPSSTNKYVTNDDTTGTGTINRASVTTAQVKFGGTGSDGALSIAAGTTTIDLLGASEVILNYTSISITGTGALAFTNPNINGTVVMLRSQGDVTLTSSATPMIDASGLGALYGAGGSFGSGGFGAGATGNPSLRLKYVKLTAGTGGGAGSGGGNGGTKDFSFDFLTSTTFPSEVSNFYELAVPGSGGAGGGGQAAGGGSAVGGHGGRGGGGLLIECRGAWNFTTAGGISVAGQNGQDAVSITGLSAAAGGAGGGGGVLQVLYNTLTSNTGTVTVTGGSPGTALGAGGFTGETGGGGASVTAAGGSALNAAGTAAGGAGISLIRLNISRA